MSKTHSLRLTDSELALLVTEFRSSIDNGAEDLDYETVLNKAEALQVRAARGEKADQTLKAVVAAIASPHPGGEAMRPVVPEIDYYAAIEHCRTKLKHAQGTAGCIAFASGAEWFRQQVLAATPPTEAQPLEPKP